MRRSSRLVADLCKHGQEAVGPGKSRLQHLRLSPTVLQESSQHTATHKWVSRGAFLHFIIIIIIMILVASVFYEPPASSAHLDGTGLNVRSRCAQGSVFSMHAHLFIYFIISYSLLTLFSCMIRKPRVGEYASSFFRGKEIPLMSCRCWHVYIHSVREPIVCHSVSRSSSMPVCTEKAFAVFIHASVFSHGQRADVNGAWL